MVLCLLKLSSGFGEEKAFFVLIIIYIFVFLYYGVLCLFVCKHDMYVVKNDLRFLIK